MPCRGTAAITGAVGGDGGLLKEGEGWFWLFNPANTYAGATTVTQGNLAVAPVHWVRRPSRASPFPTPAPSSPVSPPAPPPTASATRRLTALADTTFSTAPASTALGFDTCYEDFAFTSDFPFIRLKKLGTHTLNLTGSAPDLGPVDVAWQGTRPDRHRQPRAHTYSVAVGAAPDASARAVLRLAGTALNTSG